MIKLYKMNNLPIFSEKTILFWNLSFNGFMEILRKLEIRE